MVDGVGILYPGSRSMEGITRYSQELVKALKRIGQQRVCPFPIYDWFHLGDRSFLVKQARQFMLGPPIISFLPSVILGDAVASLNLAIVHLTAPYLSFSLKHLPKGVVKVVTWHDFFEFTERHGLQRPITRRNYLYALEASTGIICNSTLTLGDVRNFVEDNPGLVEYDAKSITAIPLGVGEEFRSAQIYTGPRRDFVYVGRVGRLAEYKRFPETLAVFSRIRANSAERVRLHVFTSSPGGHSYILGQAHAHGLRVPADVAIHMNSRDEELVHVLGRAVSLLHFSKAEGFGLPILESMALGTPVIVSKDGRIPEEVSRYAFKETFDGAADLAVKLMSKSTPSLPQSAITYARGFSWDHTAEETLRFYDTLS